MPHKDSNKRKTYHKNYNLKNKDKLKNQSQERNKRPEVKLNRVEYLNKYYSDPKIKASEKNRKAIDYKSNSITYKQRVEDRRKENKQLIIKIQLYYGCQNPDCKWDVELKPCQLEFHHLVPATKKKAVSTMMNYSRKTIANEINKCVLLCRNCHALVHSDFLQLNPNLMCCVDSNLLVKGIENGDTSVGCGC